jgi:SAM-dependent methyltransferase
VSFKDHFSSHAAGYAAHRPRYPDALADYLAGRRPRTDLALDCGCGTGPALDAPRPPLRTRRRDGRQRQADRRSRAAPPRRVPGRPGRAKRLARRSADLVAAAQAAHWFDLPAFYAEARRVGRPGAVLALISYGVLQTDEAIGPAVHRFYREVVGPFWPPERRHVEDGYPRCPSRFPRSTEPRSPSPYPGRSTNSSATSTPGRPSAERNARAAARRSRRSGRSWRRSGATRKRRAAIRFPLAMRLGRLDG